MELPLHITLKLKFLEFKLSSNCVLYYSFLDLFFNFYIYYESYIILSIDLRRKKNQELKNYYSIKKYNFGFIKIYVCICNVLQN